MSTVGNTVRWGIAGPGAIAVGFANGLAELDDARLVAVGSRAIERAQAFAEKYEAPHAHGSYAELAENHDVDVVYVATVQSRHMDDTLMFIEAGKHVLCEKPFALNAAQAQRMFDAARANGVFVMEALWSRFLPAYVKLRELLNDGAIGEPNYVEASFAFRREFDPTNRLFDLAQGGGCLLDLGVYPLNLAHFVLGEPATIRSMGHIGKSGVDEVTTALLGYDSGAVAVAKAGLSVDMGMAGLTGMVSGTEGRIDLPAFMHCPNSLTLIRGRESTEIACPVEGQGLKYQAVEVHRCLREGLLESPVMPHSATLSLARTMDTIRADIGMKYPGE